MRVDVVTLFPELLEGWLQVGLLGKAPQRGQLSLRCQSPRDFAQDKHRSVDDTPYGGGGGMVMAAPPLAAAMDALDARAAESGEPKARRVLLTPQGAPFCQRDAERLAGQPAVMLVCGRYEGVDERVRGLVDEQISLGDFVVNGGEVAAAAVIEACARLLPGVIGNRECLSEESHADGRLEYPQYTRPREFRGKSVPEVLLSGNHAEIADFRRSQALARTRAVRPDLYQALPVEERAGQPAPAVYCALLHHPVRDRAGQTVTTAVTTLDVHDIARSARTYGLKGYYVVSPITAQHVLVERILQHWRAGAGKVRMPERGEALSLCHSALELEQVREAIREREGRLPVVVATAARSPSGATPMGFDALRDRIYREKVPFLILFGTGHGLATQVLEQADVLLAPIRSGTRYNHLSVRAAAAIALDRLLGARDH